jgi:6-carboxyhexanoate--CoA ligase
MRASRKVKRQNSPCKTPYIKTAEMHISGAEGLYRKSDMQRVVRQYIERAIAHPKGKADSIVISIEEIQRKPKEIPALPVTTLHCKNPAEARKAVKEILYASGISKTAVDVALNIIRDGRMRGAAIISARKGSRLEPDRDRGIRVSRLGIGKSASGILSSKLSRHGLNNDTVKEALMLASKVVSNRDVIAELCVSDDPDYTTGYVASRKFGYVRIPHIKPQRSTHGGRTFFVKEGTDIAGFMNYLERTPAIITKVSPCRDRVSIDELVSNPYQ